MSSVDDRIVNMQFNNKQFTQGVTETKKQLEDLEHTLANTAKSGGLKEMGSSVDHVSSRFDALKVAGITAVATIAHKVTEAGISLVKSMSVDPILAGFKEYELNLKSVQTIMANTGESIETTNKFLKQLNDYSDRTVYNFGQMASAIGRFTAAGVELPQATSAIKGMANVAALTGADANQLNVAMYQMSQALAAGTIRLMDWRSLENANMGTENMRQALMDTAHAMGEEGEALDAAMKKHHNFRDSLTEGWLSAEIFTKTMKVMAGTVNDAGETVAFTVKELRGMGYSKQAAQELNRLSAASIDSATKIKTFTQMIDVIKESIGSGWAQVFQNLFGNLTEASNLWTTVGNKITGSIGGMFDSFNHMLAVWKEAGGYEALWNGFGNIFQALGNIIRPFITAFQTLFPTTGKAGEGLADLSKGFETVTGWLEKATRGMDVLTPVLVAIAEGFKMAASFIPPIVKGLAPLAPVIRNIADAIGDLLSQGADIGTSLLQGLVEGINPAAVQTAVVGFATSIIDWIKDTFGISSPSIVMIAIGHDMSTGLAQGLIEGAKLVGQALGILGEELIEAFSDMFSGMNAMDFAALMNAVLTGAMLLVGRQFLGAATNFTKAMSGIAEGVNGLNKTFSALQTSLKAKAILDIAIAVAVLAASVIALSLLDPAQLAIGLGAISSMMALLIGSMKALSAIGADKQMAIIATSIALVSGAMISLAAAVTILGQQDPEAVARGIAFMAISLRIITGAVMSMAGITGQLIAAAGAIFIISNALIVLSGAVLAFGLIDPKTLAIGLGAIAIALKIVVSALMQFAGAGPGVFAASAAIFVVAGAMIVLANAVGTLGKMNVKTLAKGLGAIAVGLTLMVVALLILAPQAPMVAVVAASLLTMSIAMIALAKAVSMFGAMGWGTLGKGFAAIAAGLLLLIGAAALAQFVAPGLLVLGVTMLLLGEAMLLAGAGMLMFSTGFALLAAVGLAGIAVLSAAIMAFITLLPQIAIQLAAAFVAFVETIAASSEALREAFGTIFENIIGMIQDQIPIIGDLFQALIDEGIQILSDSIPQFIELGFLIIDEFLQSAEDHIPAIADSVSHLITGFIDAFDDHLRDIIKEGTELIVNLITGIGKAAEDIATAGGDTVLSFLEAMDKWIVDNTPRVQQVGYNIARHIADAVTFGLASKASGIISGFIGALREEAGLGGGGSGAKPPGAGVSGGGGGGASENSPRLATGSGRLAFGIYDKKQLSFLATLVQAAVDVANAIIADGSKAVLKAQQKARAKERAAARKDALADIAELKAREAAKFAEKHKNNEKAKAEAKKLAKEAEKERKKADAAESAFAAATRNVERTREWEQADLMGKGDIKAERAKDLASAANRALARANAEIAEAREIMKENKKLGKKLLKEAKADRDRARKLAEEAKEAAADAKKYYKQEAQAQIDQFKAAEKAKQEAEEFEKADTTGKIAILEKRIADNEKIAANQKKLADKLLKDAEAALKTDPKKAMKLLAQAEEAAAAAQEAADQVEQDQEAIQQLLGGGGGGAGGGAIAPSRSVLEDAASAVDRYTASLLQATALAEGQQGPVQFVQNNYSPQSLSTSEIYRQSKNLISLQEVKMGVSTSI